MTWQERLEADGWQLVCCSEFFDKKIKLYVLSNRGLVLDICKNTSTAVQFGSREKAVENYLLCVNDAIKDLLEI
jgi:hypothetical protein